jgi:hypothetical protein
LCHLPTVKAQNKTLTISEYDFLVCINGIHIKRSIQPSDLPIFLWALILAPKTAESIPLVGMKTTASQADDQIQDAEPYCTDNTFGCLPTNFHFRFHYQLDH